MAENQVLDTDHEGQLQLLSPTQELYKKDDPVTKRTTTSDCIFNLSSTPLIDFKLESLLQVHLSNNSQGPKYITIDVNLLKLSNSYTVILGPTCIRNFESASGKIILYCKDVDYVYFNNSFSARGWLCIGVYDSKSDRWAKYKQGIEFTRNNNNTNVSMTTTNTNDTSASVELEDIHHQVVVIQFRLENDPVQYNASAVFTFKKRTVADTKTPEENVEHPPNKKRKIINTKRDPQQQAPAQPFVQPNFANVNNLNTSGIVINELPDNISRITVRLPFSFDSAKVNFFSPNAYLQEIDSTMSNELEVQSVQVANNRWEGYITLNTKYYTQGTYKVHVAVAGIHLFGTWTKPIN